MEARTWDIYPSVLVCHCCRLILADSREEIFVIEGKIYDHTIERWVHAGEYACRGPGQKHGPFECPPDAVSCCSETLDAGLTPGCDCATHQHQLLGKEVGMARCCR